jgi:hypothetical protein
MVDRALTCCEYGSCWPASISSLSTNCAGDPLPRRRPQHWSALTSDALAALGTLHLNDGWDNYWVKREAYPLVRAA